MISNDTWSISVAVDLAVLADQAARENLTVRATPTGLRDLMVTVTVVSGT